MYPEYDPNESSLGQSWANMLRGFQNPQQWQQVGQGIQNTAQIIPNVVESLARGGVGQAIGTMGDLRDLRNTVQSYLPQGVQNFSHAAEFLTNPYAKALIQAAPTTEQTLEIIPRATVPYEGYKQHETMGQYIAPSALKLIKTTPKGPALDKIGGALEERRIFDYDNLVKEYNALKDSRGGKVINTDLARELSPEYRADRTLSASVHEPSSALMKQLYAEKLAQPANPNSTVLFTGGGTGAGKTTALENLFPNLSQQAEIIYDTNLNKLESATKKIDQALNAGRNVNIVYVYRDPVESLTEGALSRAENMKKELGSGRTVPLEEHLKTHVGVREVIPQLMEQYKDNPKVSIGVINNTFGKGKAQASSLEELPMFDPAEMSTKLRDALESELKAGKISKETYEGTLGK
jgi:hypothetical protein